MLLRVGDGRPVSAVTTQFAEIVPLTWAFEDEHYNIAAVMPDTIDRPTARQIAASANATASAYVKVQSPYPSTLSVIPDSWRKMGAVV
jgi:hypothetical protein